MYQLKLSPKDHERYGGPEVFVIDGKRSLTDLDYDQLVELERDMLKHDGLTLARLFGEEWPKLTTLGIRGMVWVARQLAEITEPKWVDFKPNTVAIEMRMAEDGDAVPPTGGSSEPTSTQAPSKRR